MKFLGNPSSGSTANLTYSHNRAGQYTRNRRAPVQPIGTGRRAFIRAAFGNASQAWSTLDPETQAAWSSYAAEYPVTDSLGQSITLTGQQMFISIFTQSINCGSGTTPAVPASRTQDVISPAAISWGTIAAPLFTVTWTPGGDANFVLVAASAPVSPGVSFMKTFWQTATPAANLGTLAIRTEYEAQFGSTSVGQKIFVKLTPVNQYFVTGTPTIISSIVARV